MPLNSQHSFSVSITQVSKYLTQKVNHLSTCKTTQRQAQGQILKTLFGTWKSTGNSVFNMGNVINKNEIIQSNGWISHLLNGIQVYPLINNNAQCLWSIHELSTLLDKIEQKFDTVRLRFSVCHPGCVSGQVPVKCLSDHGYIYG